MEKLYSIEDAAEKLGGLSKHTVAKYLTDGRLQRTKIGGRTMIAESELQKLCDVGGVSRVGKRLNRTTAITAESPKVG